MPQEEDFFKSEHSNLDAGEEPAVTESDKSVKGNSRSRILLLVLLLLVVAAAALFYLEPGLFTPEVAQSPAPPVRKKVVKLPAPEPPAKAQPVEKVELPPEKDVVKEEVVEQPVAAVEKVERPAEAQQAVAPEVPPAEEQAEPEEKVAEEVAPAPVKAGKFILQVGAYILKSNLKSVTATVEKLGYQPLLETDTKKVEMTRLKLGSYEKVAGQAKLDEIRRLAPDAFAVWHDGQMTLYAGSYYSLDQARSDADRLYAEGVRVEEEKAEVDMPITIVRFGAFGDHAEADKVAAQARDAGLEVAVVKNR